MSTPSFLLVFLVSTIIGMGLGALIVLPIIAYIDRILERQRLRWIRSQSYGSLMDESAPEDPLMDEFDRRYDGDKAPRC